ncbi:MAG: hypothetical protein NVS4B5_11680 [Vulcanimicrobiaceae bacterium]
MRQSAKISVLLACASLIGCSGGGGGASAPTFTPPALIVRDYPFAAGRAVAPVGETAWNITDVRTTLSGRFGGGAGNIYDTLQVDVTFVQDIKLPAPGQKLSNGDQLGMTILFDSDNNPNTGTFADCRVNGNFRPGEFESEKGTAGRLSDGNYSIYNSLNVPIKTGSGDPSSEAVVSVNGKVLSETFFLPSIGVFSGTASPRFGIVVFAFNGNTSILAPIDCVPADGRIELPVN